MIIFNLLFAYYNIKVIEFESCYLTIANRIKEILILAAEIFMMLLCRKSLTDEFKDVIGWIVVVMLASILVMELGYGFYLQAIALKNGIKRLKNYCKKRKQKRAVQQEKEKEDPRIPTESSANMLTIET